MATIRDVARESGVSVATVSYVLNNGPRPVGTQTRERVLAVVKKLNYHPNATARRLAGRQMHTVGVLFGYVESDILTNPYAATVLQGILSAAAAAGYNVTLFTTIWENADVSANEFRDGRTDGVLVVAPLMNSDMVAGLSALEIPVVCVSGPSDTAGVPFVDVDNDTGARLATEYLIQLGHKRIAHIGGHNDHADVGTRRNAFLRTLQSAGITIPASYIPEGTYDWLKVKSIVHPILTQRNRPTAIFAGNDTLALECLDVARALGLRVPEDLSIVGFDDLPVAQRISPSLTTVRQPLIEIGSEATRLLVRMIQAREKDEIALPSIVAGQEGTLLEPELIIRNSSGPPGTGTR